MKESIDFPGFKYGAFERPTGRMNLSLYGYMDICEQVDFLAPKSSPLADRVAFYIIGRDLTLGLKRAEALPESVKIIGRTVYEDCQKRRRGEDKWQCTWHKDGGLIEPEATIPGNARPGKYYVAIRYFQNIKGFNDDLTDIIATSDTVEERLWLPPGGKYVLPTIGPNTRYGLPQETTNDFEMCIEAYINADLGLTKETAKDEMSLFFNNVDEGLFAVMSDSFSGFGALYVKLVGWPWFVDEGLGSFRLSRISKEDM